MRKLMPVLVAIVLLTALLLPALPVSAETATTSLVLIEGHTTASTHRTAETVISIGRSTYNPVPVIVAIAVLVVSIVFVVLLYVMRKKS